MITIDNVAKWRSPYENISDHTTTWATLAQVLLDCGFIYVEYDGLGTDILQVKSGVSNLIAQIYGDTVTLYDGRPTVWHCFGRAVDVDGLRLLIACAEVDQAIGG